MAKSFAEEPFSVALHPTSFMAAVGFVDKLRLFTVLMDDVRWADCTQRQHTEETGCRYFGSMLY